MFEQKGDVFCLSKWILIGALAQCVVLAPLIILYTREGVSETTVTVTTTSGTTTTTTAFSFQWYATGSIVAGTGSIGSNSTSLYNPYGLALDSSNSLYVADRSNHRVQKYQAGSLVGTTVAGQINAVSGSSPAYLNEPGYLALDSNNGFYVSDCQNHRVQYWANGATSGVTVAGNGILGTAMNQFNTPRGVSLDPRTNGLYVADQYNDRIMYYASGARTGVLAAGGNGCGSLATQLCQPVGFQFDSTSNSLFIANFASNTLVRWTIGANESTIIAGVYNNAGSTSTLLDQPTGLVLDSMGNIFLADTGNHRIILFMKGQSNGTTIAGVAGSSGSSLSSLNWPFWVSIDSRYNLYVSDRDNQRVIKFLSK